MTNTASRFWAATGPNPRWACTSAISSFVTAARSAAATSTTSRRPPPAARASPSPERGVDTHALSLGFSKRFGAQKISIVLMGNKVEYKGDSAVDGDREGWRVIPATIYRYYLSKHTHFWASASTSQSGGLYKKAREFEKDPTKAWDVGAGLVHHS